ncbi:alpha/beta hydrolase [Streptomyces melanogenes]|uniref:Alpha/beta hydrolase n=1 Tax=Streptomyces melanogenes TaxID=67326 RepID=A0ABZ1XT40_9ACTN|nr:alpha/beta fold hydrolase [Streptomyces melanogenes]
MRIACGKNTRVGLGAATAVAALLALTTAPPSTAAARPAPVWHSCVRDAQDTTGQELDKAGARCAEVKVPLDHTRPGGPAVTVAVARIRATDTAHRIGALVVNEGGPADPVIDYLLDRRAALGDLAARYDLVGIDPRFAGRNAPLDCHWPTSTYFRGAGEDRAGFDRMTAFQRELAAKCRRDAAALLPYASTRNAARDLDLVRTALGERRISYLGISYGTYLGEVYTAMFPGRTDRMVLDGVHEPHHLAPWAEYGTEEVNENALRHWARWAAPRDAAYGLGATPDAVLATVDRIRTTAARRPFTVGTYRVDEHVLPVLVYGVLGDDLARSDADIAVMVGTLKRAAETGHAEPDPGLAEMLPGLFTGQYSAYGSTQTAYLCADTPGPRDPEVYRRAVERSRAAHPLFGPVLNDITPCPFWPAPRERPTVVDNDVPALMVNATGDPRVPYSEALAMHAKWPSSRLITVEDSYRHAVYGLTYGSACVNGAVNAYLADGRLPGADLRCPAARDDVPSTRPVRQVP